MEELISQYKQMGISQQVYALGEKTLVSLTDRFAQIDKIAEYNQAKVSASIFLCCLYLPYGVWHF